MKLGLICKQISLTVVVFHRNADDYREKKYVSVTYLCGYQILVLFVVFEVSLSTCKLGWTSILLVSSNIWLELCKWIFPICSHSWDSESRGNYTTLFPKPWKLNPDNWIWTSEQSAPQLTCGRSSCLLLCGLSERSPETFKPHTCPEGASDRHCLPSLHLQVLRTQPPEISTGCSPNSETEFLICLNY